MVSSVVSLRMVDGKLQVAPHYITRIKDLLTVDDVINPTEEERTIVRGDGSSHKARVLIEKLNGLTSYYVRLEDLEQ